MALFKDNYSTKFSFLRKQKSIAPYLCHVYKMSRLKKYLENWPGCSKAG